MADENPENIKGPYSSLSNDKYSDRKFEYMITNPPFGTSWSADEEFVKNEANQSNGRFLSTLPRTSEGSLLFLQIAQVECTALYTINAERVLSLVVYTIGSHHFVLVVERNLLRPSPPGW